MCRGSGLATIFVCSACTFLTPRVMEILQESVEREASQPVLLTPALAQLSTHERYLATELEGTRYNLGIKYGLLTTQLALALNGDEREEVLAQLVELLASRNPAG